MLITSHWVTIKKAIDCHEKWLEIATEIGDQAGVGKAYHGIGMGFFFLEQIENAVDNFVSAVDVFNALRSLLKSQDNSKISFRDVHNKTYTVLWVSLLIIGKIDEALFAAEQGRAQTLSDNLLLQYKLNTSFATIDTKETISRLFTKLSLANSFSSNGRLYDRLQHLVSEKGEQNYMSERKAGG